MRARVLYYFCAAALLSLACCGMFSRPEPNEPAALFSLPAVGGGKVSLDSQRGKIVMIHFWASWCATCTSELNSLHNLYRYINSDQFEILSIAIDDSWPAINAVQSSQKLSFPMLFDESGAVRKAYGVAGIPQTFLVGRDGAFILFPLPESGEKVLKTMGPQRWDDAKTAEFFKSLIQ